MDVIRRSKAIADFKSKDLKIRVLLMNFSTAASGTNLIEASHIFFMDPLVNCNGSPADIRAMEAQAIGRAYRQGQRKHVVVVRFLIKDSVEHLRYSNIDDAHEEEIKEMALEPCKLSRSSSLGKLFSSNTLVRQWSVMDFVEDENNGNNAHGEGEREQ